jgi:hypothetical protein
MKYKLVDHPKGTYLNGAFEPAKAGQKARFRVETIDTPQGRLVGAAVPLGEAGPLIGRDRIGQATVKEA